MVEKAHLHAALAKELVSGPEGHLDHGAELRELLGGVGLDVGNALKVRCGSQLSPGRTERQGERG